MKALAPATILPASRRTVIKTAAALLGTSSALGMQVREASAASASDKLAMNGMFYGIDASCDTSGNTVYKYRRPTAVRFRAELTGAIVAVRWNHRFNIAGWGERDATHNYSSGSGGTIRLEIRRNDPGLEHPPLAPSVNPTEKFAPLLSGNADLLARTDDISNPTNISDHPTLRFQQPAPVLAGQRYWCVFNQLHASQWVSVNSAHIKGWTPGNTVSKGGPYYDDCWHIARSGTSKNSSVPSWLYQNGSFGEESRHFVKVQFLYRLPDGQEIWSGYGSVYANGTKGPGGSSPGSQRSFSNQSPIRMVFTPTRPTFRTSRLWWRAYRSLSEDTVPGDMTIKLYRGATLLGSWTSPPSSWVKSRVADITPAPPPIPFIALNFGPEIELRQGQPHHLVFGAVSGAYVTHAQQIATYFRCRNTFTDGHAQYSTNGGATWSAGWHLGAATNRKDMVLPFMFEVET